MCRLPFQWLRMRQKWLRMPQRWLRMPQEWPSVPQEWLGMPQGRLRMPQELCGGQRDSCCRRSSMSMRKMNCTVFFGLPLTPRNIKARSTCSSSLCGSPEVCSMRRENTNYP